jgi:hypothetical protein
MPDSHRALAYAGIAVSWLVAAAFVAAATILPFILVANWVASVSAPESGNGFADLGPMLAGALLSCMSGILAGALGGSLAVLPALCWLTRRRGRRSG